MKYVQLNEELKASQLVFGCMRISAMDKAELTELIQTALDEGINFFDHADIYGRGKSESLFGEVLHENPEMRSKMILQTKCSIRGGKVGYYDFSKEHILKSVEESLQRLQTSYIDILLLHRPDTLMELEEVRDAFNELEQSGKVKYFGVSNMNSMQMEFLQSGLQQKLIINQLQFNPINSRIVSNGLFANMPENEAMDTHGFILEYCRLKGVTIQPWSILQASWEEGTFLDHPDYAEFNACLQEYADQYGVTKAAIIIAWILRHPAKMQPIFGTTNKQRLHDLCRGCEVELSREDWYVIYTKAIGKRLP